MPFPRAVTEEPVPRSPSRGVITSLHARRPAQGRHKSARTPRGSAEPLGCQRTSKGRSQPSYLPRGQEAVLSPAWVCQVPDAPPSSRHAAVRPPSGRTGARKPGGRKAPPTGPCRWRRQNSQSVFLSLASRTQRRRGLFASPLSSPTTPAPSPKSPRRLCFKGPAANHAREIPNVGQSRKLDYHCLPIWGSALGFCLKLSDIPSPPL